MGTALAKNEKDSKETNDQDLKVFDSPIGPRIIIIGAGPVGIRCASHIKANHEGPCHLAVINGENYAPYDRIKLTQLLTNQVNYPDIYWSASSQEELPANPFTTFQIINTSVISIDRNQKKILTSSKQAIRFDYLIIATGSKPHIPNIEGVHLTGVYTFRNLRDAEFLTARTHRSRHAVVVGGGLLGLEAAKGLHQKNTLVTLVHQAPRLMNRQLDDPNAEVLLDHVRKLGINVITNDGLGAVHGLDRVKSISTRQGKYIECDTVVLCTGIKPNTDLAKASGLKFNRGIVVDEKLNTSQPGIFAIGECSEFEGQVYGLVSPGLEQATILADNLSGGSSVFTGAQPYTKLKVMDVKVSSLGEVANFGKRPKLKLLTFKDNFKDKESSKNNLTIKFRTIALQGNKIFGYKLLGACGIGEWPELQRLRESLAQNRTVYPWQLWLFKLRGKLWLNADDNNPTLWPPATIVCQCNQITRQTIEDTINRGYNSISSIGQECNAGTVCGSCQPTLQVLLTHRKPSATKESLDNPMPALSWKLLIASFLSALLVFLVIAIPGLEPPSSVQEFSLSNFLENKFYKQVSGFSLLAVVAIGLALTLRKRLKWEFLGKFTRWRLIHTITGVISLAILIGHTGANLGDQLNRILMLNFLLIAFIGATLGIAISFSQAAQKARVRTISFWLHIVAAWPLPILLSAHIFSSYYF